MGEKEAVGGLPHGQYQSDTSSNDVSTETTPWSIQEETKVRRK